MTRECAGICSRIKVGHYERNYRFSNYCELCATYFLKSNEDIKCICCTTKLRTRRKYGRPIEDRRVVA